MTIVETIELMTFIYAGLTLVMKLGIMFSTWGLLIASVKLVYAVTDWVNRKA